MKYVRLNSNLVSEIIPDYALPVAKWYGEEFASTCMEAPDDVQQGWRYDSKTKIFSPNSPELETLRQSKLMELSTACDNIIYAGCDVTLSDGAKGHISLTEKDQINLTNANAAIEKGATGYPYHLDGGNLCRIFPAADIMILVQAATKHILYNTTYCNHLNVWVKRCTTVEEFQAITYGADLPADLVSNMNEVLGHVG